MAPEAPTPGDTAAAPVALLPDAPSRLPSLAPLTRGLGWLFQPLACLTEASWRVPMTLASAAALLGAVVLSRSGVVVRVLGMDGPVALGVLGAGLAVLAAVNWRAWREEQRGTVLLRQEPTGRKLAVTITRRHDTLPSTVEPIDCDAWIRVIGEHPDLRYDTREYDLRNPVTGKLERRKAGRDTGVLDIGEEQVTLKWINGEIRADAVDVPEVWRPLLRVARYFRAGIVDDASGERIDWR